MAITPKPIKSNHSTLLIIPGRYKILLQNQKAGGSRELFLPEYDLQSSSIKIFQKSIQILEAWKPTNNMKFMPFYI